MATSSILAFWAVALLLIVVPGADWAFVLGAALGHHSAVPAVGGLVIGYAAMTVAVAAGVGALVTQSTAVLTVLTAVGGLYLIWHGATTVARPSTADTAASPSARTRWATIRRGIGVSALNPKGLLIFVALLPQFTDPARSFPITAQVAALGLVFIVNCAVFYLGLGLFAHAVLRGRPVVARAISRGSGAAMMAIGALLVVERLTSFSPVK